MDSNVNPQPTDAHIRISHEIHRELIRRKFTQRQRDIIDFVLTLSWGCGKPSAKIPMLKHFELCGVRKEHIKKELKKLVENHVLFWDEHMNVFQINKHYDMWTVDVVERYDPKMMNDLIKINIETPTPNLGKPVTKKVTELPKKQPIRVTKKVTQLHKRQLFSYQKGNSPVTKKVTVKRDFSCHTKGFRLSKTIFKAIIKKTTTTSLDTVQELDIEQRGGGRGLPSDHSFGYIYRAYENNFADTGKVTPFETEDLGALFDDYGGEWLLKAMREAVRQKKKSLAYVRGTLEGYRKRGGPETERRMDRASPAEAEIREDDPITILMRKADEQRLAEYGVT
ncbi:Replication initiation and membrane attachment [compost metagenome]